MNFVAYSSFLSIKHLQWEKKKKIPAYTLQKRVTGWICLGGCSLLNPIVVSEPHLLFSAVLCTLWR